jgi:hypothetical protein
MEKEIFGMVLNSSGSEDRGILGEDRARGWKAVDESCPAHIRQHIMEVRSAKLEGREARAFVRQGATHDTWREDAFKRLSQIK